MNGFQHCSGKHMGTFMILIAFVKKQKHALFGICMLILFIVVTLITSLSSWINAYRYTQEEMDRLQYGDLSVWVSDVKDMHQLEDQLKQVDSLKALHSEQLIYANYEIKDIESDSEGQLILYQPDEVNYRILRNDLQGYEEHPAMPDAGEIYISPSLKSSFDIEVGDTITFPLTRQNQSAEFIVKGYYENPYMGSSMIGMKGFLINETDYNRIVQILEDANIDALARSGSLFHMYMQDPNTLSISQFNSLLNEKTDIAQYTEFSHSYGAILEYMMILQHTFTGFLLVFTIILIYISLIVIKHSIHSSLEQDYKDMGILKAIGYTAGNLQRIQITMYFAVLLIAMVCGIIIASWGIKGLNQMSVTSLGLLIPNHVSILVTLICFIILASLIYFFVYHQTKRIHHIKVLDIIRDEQHFPKNFKSSSFHKKYLNFWIALRQIISNHRHYISTLTSSLLLVFIISLIGRMNSWLGPQGEGMMEAFNPADHDIGVQSMGSTREEEILEVINSYTGVHDRYRLAMPSLQVEGSDMDANVISDPSRFHILQGETSDDEDEVVITNAISDEMNVSIGDTLTISQVGIKADYRISGIYQCANDMGQNIGMSERGYQRIAQPLENIWCYHYFLDDKGDQQTIIKALEEAFGAGVHIHENTWPGLSGIIAAMHILMITMYLLTALFILVVASLAVRRIMIAEKHDIGIYKVLGYQSKHLRISFMLRFGIISLIGSSIAFILSMVFGDTLIISTLRLLGISSYTSNPNIITMVSPLIVVVFCFLLFSYLCSGSLRKSNINILIKDE